LHGQHPLGQLVVDVDRLAAARADHQRQIPPIQPLGLGMRVPSGRPLTFL
jgi:hypothetical protein